MSDEINVISRTQCIIVEPTSSSVSVINAGPQGPSGNNKVKFITPTGDSAFDNDNFQAAVTSAIETDSEIIIGPGNLYITVPITGWPTGGSFSSGTVKGIRVRGQGRGITTITYAPTSATFMITLGNGSDACGWIGFEDITFVGGNNTLAGILRFIDPTFQCWVKRCMFLGNGGVIGNAVQMDGQVVANSQHLFEQNYFKYWASGIRFSGFANSNKFLGNQYENVTHAIHMEALSPDTLGGSTNKFIGEEINGSTGVGFYLRSAASRNTFDNITCDGATLSADISASCSKNRFVTSVIDTVPTLTGAAADTTMFLDCIIADEYSDIILGDVRIWRYANNEIKVGSGISGASGANVVAESFRGYNLRLQDETDPAQSAWMMAVGSPATNDFALHQYDAAGAGHHSNSILIKHNATDDMTIGYATQKIGFYAATPIVKPTITGSRGGNAALASLLTQLETLGLIVNSSS